MSVAIWGTAFSGEQMYNIISSEEDIVLFVDNDRQKWGGSFKDKEICAPDMMFERIIHGEINKIFLGLSVVHYEDVYLQIKKSVPTFDEIYGIDKANKVYKLSFSEGEKPILPYLEFDAVRKCNLNCRACCHFSNIVMDSGNYTLEKFNEDFSKLRELFERIEVIRVVGGEPLLNKRLHKLLYGIKHYFHDSQIEIVSNGLLVTQMPDELVEAIVKEDVYLCITQYDVTRRIMEDIRKFCKDKGITVVEFGYDRSEFKKFINIKGDSDGKEMFKQCQFKKCTTLYNGRITHCCLEAYSGTFNEKYETAIPENQGIDIFSGVSGWEIKEYLNKASATCNFCTEPMDIDWENGKNDAQMLDWVTKC